MGTVESYEKEKATYAYQWDRVATGRRHPSLHMDVRFLACPTDKRKSLSPSRDPGLNATKRLQRREKLTHLVVALLVLLLPVGVGDNAATTPTAHHAVIA